MAVPAWAATPTLVQHVSTSNTIKHVPAITVRLPNPTLPGNAIILVVQFDDSAGAALFASSVGDNKGNVYTAGPTVTGTNNQSMALFYVLNATAGVTAITASFSGAEPSFVETIASEWQNIVAARGSGLASFGDTDTDSWTAIGTLGASGDLVYQVAAQTAIQTWNGPSVAAGTQSAGFTLASVDLMEGTAAQYQVANGPVTNPTLTPGMAASYVTVAMAFVSGLQGSAPTGIHIVRVQHSHLNPEAGTVINLQFPSSGNLIIAGGPTGAADEASGVVSSIDSSPSNAWVQVPGSPLSNGGGGTTLMWYAADAATSSSLTVTLTLAAPSVGGNFTFLDVAGAASDPFDTSNTAAGVQDSDGNLTTVSLTPAGPGELIVAFGDQNVGTITGVAADSNGHVPLFGEPTWTGQDESDFGVGAGNAFTLDAQMAFITTRDISAHTFIWTGTRAVSEWETIAAAFKGGSGLAALMTPVPGTALPGAETTFRWSAGAGALQYSLSVGTTGSGSFNVYSQGQGTNLSATVSGLPVDGSPVYVRLWTQFGGDIGWLLTDYTYAAASLSKAALTSPAPGTTLPGAVTTFNWSAAAGALQYSLSVGTTGPGSFNVYSQGQGTNLSATVSGLPVDGSPVYVRLWTQLGGGTGWVLTDYTYAAASQSKAVLTSPAPGTTLPGGMATLQWSPGTGALQYSLSVGTTGPGSFNLYSQGQGTNLSATVSGLPVDGSPVYVRLWTQFGGGTGWVLTDYTYVAANQGKAVLTSPAPGTTLPGAVATFNWSAGAGALQYSLSVGTTGPGSFNVYSQGQGTNLSATVNRLPVDGSPVYVRLWTQFGGGTGWVLTDYTYAAASQSKAVLTSPAPGTRLPGAVTTFSWSPGTGALQYSLSVGTTGPGSFNVYSQGQGTNLSATVSGLPVDGSSVYVRLWTQFGGGTGWVLNDFTYTAATVDVRGTYAISGFITQSQCTNPANNGSFALQGSATFTGQPIGSFTGNAILAGSGTQTTIALSGNVTAQGQISGTFTFTTNVGGLFAESGAGTLGGAIAGNSLNLAIGGQVQTGETCLIAGTLAGTK